MTQLNLKAIEKQIFQAKSEAFKMLIPSDGAYVVPELTAEDREKFLGRFAKIRPPVPTVRPVYDPVRRVV